MKRLPLSVLIPDGESDHSLPVIQQLAAGDRCRVHVLSTDPDAIISSSKYCSTFEVVTSDLTAEIKSAAKRHPIDVVLPVSERGIQLAAANRAELTENVRLVRLAPPDSIAVCLDKALFANALLKDDLPVPPTVVLDDDLSVDQLSWPLLAKPTFGHAGNGIVRLESERELRARIDSGGLPVDGTFILQSFVSGYDIDCSFLAAGGELVAHTVQRGLAGGQRSYSAPVAVEFVHSPEIVRIVSDLVRHLEWDGVGHVDLRADEATGNLYVIELNPRFWASIHGSYKAGINFPLLLVADAVGLSAGMSTYKGGAYMGFDAWLRKLGLVRKKEGYHWIRPHRTSLDLMLRDPKPHFRTFARRLRRNKGNK